MDDILLKLNNITKFFPGVKALSGVSFDIRKAEVHAICGENGAGKSTLINILAGNYLADDGTIEIKGKPVKFTNHMQSLEKGISVVYQERSLVPTLSVAENIFADRQHKNKAGAISFKEMYKKTRELLDEIGLNVSPKTLVGTLPPAKQQMVELAKALSIKSDLLILDEPTATITTKETEILFSVIGKLKKQGISIIYISHRLQEVMDIADRVTVLKDGKYMGTRDVLGITTDELVKLMVGRDLVIEDYNPQFTDETVLEVKNFTSNKFNGINFKLKKGEILSFSGLAGAGRTEIFRALIGVDPRESGEVFVRGRKVEIRDVEEAIKNGIAYLTEDRKDEGLFLTMSICKNIVSASLDKISKGSIINDKDAVIQAVKYKDALNIITPNINKLAGELSGGNQQKVCFAKWLMVDSDILIIDEPTRGIDVGAKSEIYRIIRSLTAQGKSVIVISSDLPEVLGISDRIVVMYQGTIRAEILRAEASEEKIMHWASGLN